MDPLSEVISFLEPKRCFVGGFEAGGDWSIRFGTYEGIKCYAVTSGACWLAVEGAGEPMPPSQGPLPLAQALKQNGNTTLQVPLLLYLATPETFPLGTPSFCSAVARAPEPLHTTTGRR
jgi:hypothetical protein